MTLLLPIVALAATCLAALFLVFAIAAARQNRATCRLSANSMRDEHVEVLRRAGAELDVITASDAEGTFSGRAFSIRARLAHQGSDSDLVTVEVSLSEGFPRATKVVAHAKTRDIFIGRHRQAHTQLDLTRGVAELWFDTA